MLIKIDYREADLLSKINTLLPKENITITSENLPLGDIIICEDNGTEKIIIERKTLPDLASSIRDGRYKEQSFRLNECSLVNHNIIYLIEGNLQTYKPYLKGNVVDKYALLSSFVSISYYKGFSLYKANNIEESAEWILQLAYKIGKEGGKGFYSTAVSPVNNEEKYSHAMKRTKKNNITPENIGEIMLNQIPNVSSAVATAIMEKFKTIKALIEAFSQDIKALNNITTVNKNGQARKISKTSIDNIYNYLVETPADINIL
uniref:ERCC4 domain-containing protein n=1 Tax=viral metagenome TaxID=1070528 RepID=A0A6C0IJL1_9ZZZZ